MVYYRQTVEYLSIPEVHHKRVWREYVAYAWSCVMEISSIQTPIYNHPAILKVLKVLTFQRKYSRHNQQIVQCPYECRSWIDSTYRRTSERHENMVLPLGALLISLDLG